MNTIAKATKNGDGNINIGMTVNMSAAVNVIASGGLSASAGTAVIVGAREHVCVTLSFIVATDLQAGMDAAASVPQGVPILISLSVSVSVDKCEYVCM